MGAVRTAVALIVLILVAGCVSTAPIPSPAASDAASPQWPSDTSYGRLFSQVQPDGSVSMDVALLAFSTAIATLPGVPVAPGGPPNDFERADGTFAINWLTPYLDQITPDQRAVVDATLAPETGHLVEPARAVADVAGGIGPVTVADDASKPYMDAIDSARTTIVSRLHRDLNAQIFFALGPALKDIPRALAYAFSDANNGCQVRATPLLAGSSQTRINVTMAHETFHCFQFDIRPDHGRSKALDWIMEGQAEWVGEDVAGPGVDGAAWWSSYLFSPQIPLFQRSYDAVGFYEHLVETGTSPWSVLDAMLATPTNNEAAFKAAGADNDGFVDTWASGMSRLNTLPPAWYAQGRWYTNALAPEPYEQIANGTLVHVSVPEAANRDMIVDTQADVTELYFVGHVRMYTNHTDTPEIPDGLVDLCNPASASGCKCPPGSAYNGPPLTPTDGRLFLAMTAGLLGVDGTIRGISMSDFCAAPPSTNPHQPAPRGGTNPCANGCAGTIGDPHFETLDQRYYGFQAAGEYTLLRSPNGSMEMQGRQVPYSGDIPNVSINSALAWRVAGHRVGMYANEGSETYSLFVDGKQVDPTSFGTMDLGDGAALTAMDDGLEVAYGDGTIATVLFHGNGFADALDLAVAPSDTFRSQAVGLLGPLAAGSELPALPDGSALPLSQDQATRFTQRYKQLGPAWLVSDQTSLFDYQPGQTTATFYKPDFPSEDSPEDLDLDALQQFPGLDDATGKCAYIQAEPNLNFDCIFDTLLTGDPAFAQAYAMLQQFLTLGPAVLQTPQVETTPTPAPTLSVDLPQGLIQVASGISLIDGATVGPDGTVYASLSTSNDYAAELVSVGPGGAPGATITTSGSGGLFLLDGSLWMSEDDPTGYGKCLLERFDPGTLASQTKISIGCDIGGPQAVPVADGIWWLDRSTSDADGHGAMLRHLDLAAKTVDRSVELPFVNGSLSSGTNTVFFGDSGYGLGWYRLSPDASAFAPMNLPDNTLQIIPAGNGVWYQPEGPNNQLDEADFVTTATPPDHVIPIDGYLTAADEGAIYVESPGSTPDALARIPIDGSASTTILSGATLTTSTGSDDLGFFDDYPLVIANGKIAKFWLVSDWPTADTTSVVAEVASVP